MLPPFSSWAAFCSCSEYESLLEGRTSCFPGHLSLHTPQIEVAQSAVGVIGTAHYAPAYTYYFSPVMVM